MIGCSLLEAFGWVAMWTLGTVIAVGLAYLLMRPR